MKKAFAFVGTTLLLASAAMAESWTGTLVDTMCKGKDLAAHSKDCAIKCAKGGYGIVLSDGKFVKFDESGNAKALAALTKSTKDKDLKATVSGTLDGETLKVDTISMM